MPWRAHGPDSGTTSAIFTSFGFCARARRGASAVAAPVRPSLIAVRRPNVAGVLMPVVSPVIVTSSLTLRFRQAEVRATHPIVGQQRLVWSFEHDVSRLQHVA